MSENLLRNLWLIRFPAKGLVGASIALTVTLQTERAVANAFSIIYYYNIKTTLNQPLREKYL